MHFDSFGLYYVFHCYYAFFYMSLAGWFAIIKICSDHYVSMVLLSVQGIAFKSGGDMHEPYIEVLLLTCYFMIVWCTLCLKKCSLFIFRITLQKNELILIILVYRIMRKSHIRILWTCLTWIMLPDYLAMQKQLCLQCITVIVTNITGFLYWYMSK